MGGSGGGSKVGMGEGNWLVDGLRGGSSRRGKMTCGVLGRSPGAEMILKGK